MAVHHITEEAIAEKKPFNGSLDRANLQDRLNDGYTLVAHNAKFDVGVLENHDVKTPAYICTLKLARHLYPELEAHNLQFLRYALGLKFSTQIDPHDALSDVIVLERLFYLLLAELINKEPLHGKDAEDDLEITKKRMIEITQAPSLLHKCLFGKYVGTLWRDVPREYLEWIVYKSSFDDADVLHTARFYLTTNTQLPL